MSDISVIFQLNRKNFFLKIGGIRMDRTIIEGLQDIVSVLEDHLKPLVEAELSVLVDILYRPEMLFPPGTDAKKKCQHGGFIK